MSQEQINARIIPGARQGKTIVYLKGGDPEGFGHTAERTEALAPAGITSGSVPGVNAALAAGCIDWVAVTSSAIARSLVAMFGEQLHKGRLAGISPVTSEVLRRLGYQPAPQASEYTIDGFNTHANSAEDAM